MSRGEGTRAFRAGEAAFVGPWHLVGSEESQWGDGRDAVARWPGARLALSLP